MVGADRGNNLTGKFADYLHQVLVALIQFVFQHASLPPQLGRAAPGCRWVPGTARDLAVPVRNALSRPGTARKVNND
ncbi:hypothetical protein GCM10009526_06700 [Glutamicibacter creatinolyticus]